MKFVLVMLLLCNSLISLSQPRIYAFVFLNKKEDAQDLEKDQSEKIMQGHMANIERLANEGKLLVAGPFEGGGGIFIFNTTSIDEARQWLSSDPGVQANRWNVEILLYEPTIGSICAVKEPYEMVTYNFTRFTLNTIQNIEDIWSEHHRYIGMLNNVVTAGNFGSTGSILITKNENEASKSDALVGKGFLTAERKKLWIAKGSFCEK